MGLLPFEVCAVRARTVREILGVTIPLPRPEDLIVFKAVAHRPQDLEDIRSIRRANPGLNREEVLKVVRGFSESLEMPEILADLEKVLT